MEDKNFTNGIAERQENDNSIFNLKWIITTLLAIWPWFLGSMLMAYLLCNLYLRYTTPVYKISSEIIINDTKGGGNSELMLDGIGLTTAKTDVNNVLRILRSKTLMTKVVNQLNLNVRYFEPGKVKMFEYYNSAPFDLVFIDSNASYYAGSYKLNDIDEERFMFTAGKNKWQASFGDTLLLPQGRVKIRKTSNYIKPGVEFIINVDNAYDVAKTFAGSLSVARTEKQSSSIEIATQDDIPDRGKDVVNTLVKAYEKTNIDDKNRIVNNTINFIDDRLLNVGQSLGDVEKDIQNFKESNNVTDIKDKADVLLSDTKKFNEEQVGKEVQLRVLEELEKYMLSNTTDALPAILSSDPAMMSLMGDYNKMQNELTTLGVSNTKDNPYVVNLERQMAQTRLKIYNSIKALETTLKININELNRRNQMVTGEIRQVPMKEREYLEFSRSQKIREELYLYLLKKREEAAISKSSTVSNLTVVDKADVAGLVKPNRSKLISLSLLLGFIAPIIGLGIRRTFNTKIIAKNDILKYTDIPIVGEIGHSNDDIAVAVKKNSNSILAEQFRALRTNLQFLLTDKQDKTILLTSSMSGEGKSFIAINLASTFAISGKKVVLIEFDLRRPKVSKNLGLDNGIGLSNYAIGQADLDQIIVRSGFEDNLFVIPSGPIPPNPAELIMLPMIEQLFEELKSRFDYVVLDTAPIGLVTDAQLLSRYTDTSLYIVRQGYTFKQQMQIANELKVHDKLPRLGLVINDVIFKRGYSYGYGYGYEAGYGNKYGYKYGYGYGYGYGAYSNGGGKSQPEAKISTALINKLKRKKDKI